MPTLAASNLSAGRTLREEQSYKDSIKLLGGAEIIDIALAAIIEALSNRPEGFDLVPGYEPIRIAKTDQITRTDGTTIPAIRLWFVIASKTTISLLYAEEISDDEI